MTIEEGSGSGVAGSETARIITVYKVDFDGLLITSANLDGSESSLNVVGVSDNDSGDIAVSNDYLCWMFSKTMFKSGDGLNHQNGIAVTINKQDLTLITILGQTSSHSFSNLIKSDSAGTLIGMDLGDNYPRGIHLHYLTSSSKQGKLVYGFKTKHGTTATSPSGAVYDV